MNSNDLRDESTAQPDHQLLIDLFHAALKSESAADLRAVLAAGLDPNAKETTCSPSGHQFERSLIDIVCGAIWEDDLEPLMRILLEAGADPKQSVRDDGTTPLMKAISARCFGIARALIDHGDDVNAANKAGWTVVHSACTRGEDDLKWLEMLEAAGANMDVATPDGARPMMSLACDPIRLRWMLQRVPHHINDCDRSGVSVLRRAIEYRSLEGVCIAIEHGALLGPLDPEEPDGLDFVGYAKQLLNDTGRNADAFQLAAMVEIVGFIEAVKSAQMANEIVSKARFRESIKTAPLGGCGS